MALHENPNDHMTDRAEEAADVLLSDVLHRTRYTVETRDDVARVLLSFARNEIKRARGAQRG